MDEKRSAGTVPWSYRELKFSLLLIFAIIFLFNAVLFLADFGKIFEESDKKALFSLAFFLLQEIIFLVPLFFFIFRRHEVSPATLGFRGIGILKTLKYILLGYFYFIAFGFFFTVITAGKGAEAPGFRAQETYFPLFGDITEPVNLLVAVFVLVILAPVIEEIVFRGTVLQTFTKRFGISRGNIFTALFFAFIHFQFQSFFLLAFLGLILNWIFIKTKSLYPCIGFHILNNGVAFTLYYLIFIGKLTF